MKSILFVIVALGLLPRLIVAQLPTPLNVNLTSFVSGYASPVGIYNCGDHRLFIIEQNEGDIEIIDTTGTYIGKFLDLTGLISTGGERGLLGLAFHPNYLSNGYFFVNYTNTAGNTVIARYTVSANADIADPSSASIIMTVVQPYGNHNGGHIAFGPDGYLYIAMGDGGSGGDPQNFAQNMNSRLGKMLRIDVDNGLPFTIPATNPYAGQSSPLPEIWSAGLRNPWKFSFDRLTGDMWIGDVGQNAWEEIDFEPAGSAGGLNWGWRCYEGNAAFNTTGCGAFSTYDAPIAVYSHGNPHFFCSITGGIVYRGWKFPGMLGHYLLTDYCDGSIFAIKQTSPGVFNSFEADTGIGFGGVAFGESKSGELYLVTNGGTIYKVEDNCGTFNPVLSSNGTGALAVSGGGTTYWWWLNGALQGSTATPTYTPAASGTWYATVSNGVCTLQTNSVQWLIDAGVPGCTYATATNYNPLADVDDGSCLFDNTVACPYDFNSDGIVNTTDLLVFIAAFGTLCP